jgi:hypothetical protein
MPYNQKVVCRPAGIGRLLGVVSGIPVFIGELTALKEEIARRATGSLNQGWEEKKDKPAATRQRTR